MTSILKICNNCKKSKPLTEFYSKKTGRDGYTAQCKGCINKSQREYYIKNREKRIAYSRKYRQEYPEKVYEVKRKWRENNPERERARILEWTRKNPERVAAMRHRYRAQRRARESVTDGNFTVDEWIELCVIHGDRCLACGKRKKLTIDHVIPLFHSGSNNIDNIQPLCFSCNVKKGTKIIDYRVVQPGTVL